ncbi:MAG TPA: hypothetical protein VH351_05630 [Bryobacteraceae bacterium]|jgi:hypothetical protein|nr:hypothetical protein [Bryobacteraceae bacterium]
MNLELRPEVVSRLETLASAHGLSVQEYLGELIEREFPAVLAESPSREGDGVAIEDGLPIYRSKNRLPAHVIDTAIERSREQRSRNILGSRS